MATTMVALLRGINVGGRTRLAMADLRRVVEGCGHAAVRTYVQSGNVVFTTGARSPERVGRELAAAIAALGGVAPEVVVRTAAELDAVVAANPFAGRFDDPTHLHVVFASVPLHPPLEPAQLAAFAPEELVVQGREAYLLLPGGIGRSRLAAAVARRGPAEGTVRNWRTVTTLADMAAGRTAPGRTAPGRTAPGRSAPGRNT